MTVFSFLQHLNNEIEDIKPIAITGKIVAIKGIVLEAVGINNFVSIGTRCEVANNFNNDTLCEVIGFDNNVVLLMPFSDTEGISPGACVRICQHANVVYPDDTWLGRVIDAFAKPIDGYGPIKNGTTQYKIKAMPLPSQERNRVGGKIDLGIKAIDNFITCCYGQRMGIFAGSGVGKSVLISMLTKYAKADVKVIGLIGERGREAKEFIEEYLGAEGRKSAVIIMATGDESPLMRKRAAYLTMSIAEFFRDQGKEVLCIMDSITRFAMAQREIGLAASEPPTTKGYTPSVFSELPKLLERAGPGVDKANITALFTVLVESDDQNEPISDAVRGILDGHIVLERAIAERGRFPAIDVLKSVSRTMPGCNSKEQTAIIARARKMLAIYQDMSEMIRLGAYKKGSDREVDQSIEYYKIIEEFLKQAPDELVASASSAAELAKIMS